MANGRIWTPQEIDYLERWAGQKSLVFIGKAIGRSPQACKQKMNRMGTNVSLTTEYLTVSQVAEEAGCSREKVQYLIEQGKLIAKRFKGRGRTRAGCWLIFPDDIEKCKELQNHENHGSKNGRSKLSESRVRQMRELRRKSSMSYPEIGRKFGVTHKAAENAIKGKTWKHVKEWWEPQKDVFN